MQIFKIPSFEPINGRISVAGSNATPYRSPYHRLNAPRNIAVPLFGWYEWVFGRTASRHSTSTTDGAGGRSGPPIPRLITSLPAARISSISRNFREKKYSLTPANRSDGTMFNSFFIFFLCYNCS